MPALSPKRQGTTDVSLLQQLLPTDDSDLARLGTVQLRHSLHLMQGDIVAVLEAVPGLVEARHNAVRVVRDARNHAAQRRLAICVRHHKVRAKIAKDFPLFHHQRSVLHAEP